MKIIKTGVFTLVFLLILHLITPLFVPKDINPYSVGKSQMFNGVFAEEKDSLDVIFAGDSESYTNFMPMELWAKSKIKSYNIGLPSINLRDSEKTISEILEKQKPQLLIIETNHFFRYMGNWVNDLNYTVKTNIYKLMPIINYHDNWKQLLEHGEATSVSVQRNPLKGWRYNAKIVPYVGAVDLTETDERMPLPDNNWDYIEKIIKDAQSQGIVVLLVTAPSVRNWTYQRHNTIEDIAQSMNLKHLDFNLIQKEIKLDWKKDTYDKGDHINFTGAQKVTAYLIEYLNKNYEIKTTLTQEQEDLWNKDFTKYQTIIPKNE